MDREEISAMDPEVLLFDGLDEAIVGVAARCGQPLIAVYSMARILDVLERQGLSREEAEEHVGFNVVGGWLGDRTPAVLMDAG